MLALMTMLHRVTIQDDFVFVGGGALNLCMEELLETATGKIAAIPEVPRCRSLGMCP